MTLRSFANIFLHGPRLLLFSLAGLALASCDLVSSDEDLRERFSGIEEASLKVVDRLSVIFTKGSYTDAGVQIGRSLAPSIEAVVTSSKKVRNLKSNNQFFTQTHAETSAALLGMSANFTDLSGSANEIDAIAASTRQNDAQIWNAVELGYGPEVGASGFGVTDGQQAVIGKIIGVPLAAYLSSPKERIAVATPNVRIYNPNSTMSYMVASWPLAGHPVVGLNKRGLAMTVTSFASGSPQIHSDLPFKYRRVLQTSTSVKQALRKLYTAKRLDTGATIVLADQSGALAHIECSVERCIELDVFEKSMGQVFHTAHSVSNLSLGIETEDTGFSKARLQTLKQKMVQQSTNLGTIVGAISALRSVGMTGHSQAMALVVVDPRRQTFWHSVGGAPNAVASRIVEIGFSGPTGNELPGLETRPESTAVLEMLANAENQYRLKNYSIALSMLDNLPQSPMLDNHRISYFRGLILSSLGQHRSASEFAMVAAQSDDTNLSAYALTLQAWNLAQLGDRPGAQRVLFDALQLSESFMIQDSLRRKLQRGTLPDTLNQYPTLLLY